MKKQIKKLSLNKKTISNLTAAEMANKNGGSYLTVCSHGGGHTSHCTNNYTQNQNTCPHYKTC